jgi:hypothetical protein
MDYCNQCANYRFIVPHVQICLDCWNPCHICGQEKHKGLRCPIIKTPEYKMRGSLEKKKKGEVGIPHRSKPTHSAILFINFFIKYFQLYIKKKILSSLLMSTPPRRNFGFSRTKDQTKEQKFDRPQRSSERRAPIRRDRLAFLYVPEDERESIYTFKTRVAAVSLAFGGSVNFGAAGRLEGLTYGFRAELLADPEISPLVQAIREAVDAASPLIAKRLAALPQPTASEQQESEVESSQLEDNSQE